MNIASYIYSKVNKTLTGSLFFDGGPSGSFDPNNTSQEQQTSSNENNIGSYYQASGTSENPYFSQAPAPAPTNNKGHSLSIAGFIIGLVSIFVSCCLGCCGLGVLALPIGIVGFVLSLLAKKELGTFNGFALAGLICSILGIVFGLVLGVLTIISIFGTNFEYSNNLSGWLEDMGFEIPEEITESDIIVD